MCPGRWRSWCSPKSETCIVRIGTGTRNRNISAGILEEGFLIAKAKLPGKPGKGAAVQTAAHQKTGNRLVVKRGYKKHG